MINTQNISGQFAIRGGRTYTRRLMRYQPEQSTSTTVEGSEPSGEEKKWIYTIQTPGDPNAIKPIHAPLYPPDENEVRIQIAAAGMNFSDVLKAYGKYRSTNRSNTPTIGIECAGWISGTGSCASRFKKGDPVIAISPDFNRTGCFGSNLNVSQELVAPMPQCLSMQQAAAIPIAYLTAVYSLIHLAGIKKGDHLLVHYGTGGMGMAAINVAMQLGAQVHATAGSPAKQTFLKKMGVENVYDSRNDGFYDHIVETFGPAPMDVVISAAIGVIKAQSIELLKDGGRFIDLSQEQNTMHTSGAHSAPSQRLHEGVAYRPFHLADIVSKQPVFTGELLRKISSDIEKELFAPLPTEIFNPMHLNDAIRHMAQARHIGKIVLSPVSEYYTESSKSVGVIKTEATYIISGGLGALGIKLAKWLALAGAGHIVLFGRQPPSEAATAAITRITETGTKVTVRRLDIADEIALEDLFDEIIKNGPPLKGVFHLAGVAGGEAIRNITREGLETVLRGKVDGAWTLHVLTRELDLDYFVLFSSFVSVLEVPAHGAYMAANAFLDGLVQLRRSEGLPGLSINWGPWEGTGMAAQEVDWITLIAQQGMAAISVDGGLSLLTQCLRDHPENIAVMPVNLPAWHASHPVLSADGFVDPVLLSATLSHEPAPQELPEINFLSLLQSSDDPDTQHTMVSDTLIEALTRILNIPAGRVDRDRAFKEIGLDSLMAVELANQLSYQYNIRVPATKIWYYPTISKLTDFLFEKLIALSPSLHQQNTEQVTAHQPETTDKTSLESLIDELENMSPEEANKLLSETDIWPEEPE